MGKEYIIYYKFLNILAMLLKSAYFQTVRTELGVNEHTIYNVKCRGVVRPYQQTSWRTCTCVFLLKS